MNASEMTFGVEIECFLPIEVCQRLGIQCGGYHNGIQIPGLPEGWLGQRDGSLHTRGRGLMAIEITSPILKGRDGAEQLIAVLATLKSWGFKTNKTCGLHVHVGANLDQNPIALRNLLNLSARFERALFAVTGTRSREHGHYAAPISRSYEQVAGATTLEEFRCVAAKYRSVNIAPLFTPKRTVEFRVFQGTTNATKILGYVQICLGLIENAYAMGRRPRRQCRNVRHQTGRGLFYRMARNFNWYSEARMGDVRYGVLVPERLEAIKRELSRLARKYDADPMTQRPETLPVV